MRSSALAAGIRHLRGTLAAQQCNEDSDEQLLHAFTASRNDSAFAVLVRRHGPMVLHVCRRVLEHEQDAEDAFQATFLVLARSAGSLRKKAALASWLHGTAYRIALKAKQSAARRRKHEGQAPSRPSVNPADELSWREVRTLLDEEIMRLPEMYRSAFVLCALENVGREEAARRLGVKPGTVASRLAEARKRLQRRLTRRGVELTALLVASTLTAQPASALSAGLIAKTTQTALAAATDDGLAGAVSAAVAELAKGGASVATMSKAKMATVFLLAASLLAGASVSAYRGVVSNALSPSPQPAEPPAAKADDKPKSAPPQREAAKTMAIQGRVLGVDGKPKAGAKLLLLGGNEKSTELGVTAADGRFTLAIPKETKGYLLAQADAAGIDYFDLDLLKRGKSVELRLVKDHTIHGQVINTEGKPIAGVRVGIRGIIDNTENALDSFLTARKKRHTSGRLFGVRSLWNPSAVLRAATTDADGHFTIHGLGTDRLVYLRLSGARIAEEEIWIVNRDGFDPKAYNQAPLDNFGPPREGRELGRLFGPDASVVAEAEKPIRGVITDADSGKGRANTIVYLSQPCNAPIAVPLQATTDAEGRYEIHGCRKVKSYTLEVVSDAETGYVASQVHAADTAGYQPIRADIRVKKGVIVIGKVIDRATGTSVPGTAWATVLRDNPFAKEYPVFNSSELGRGNGHRVDTAGDGTFRVVTIPGPVLLMGGFNPPGQFIEYLKYKPPLPDPKYPQYFHQRRVSTEYYRYPRGMSLVQGNFCKVLEIKPGTRVVRQDILLERASALEVKIQDAAGQLVPGVWATDIGTQTFIGPLWVEDASCSVYGLEARKPRLLVFYAPKKKLVGSRMLKGDEKPPVVMKLGSLGAVRGRLLDAEGQPLAGAAVDVSYREHEANTVHEVIHRTKQAVTDANGAFTLDELIPGLKFDLSIRRGKRRFEREAKAAEAAIQLKPGECRDLGSITLKPVLEKPEE